MPKERDWVARPKRGPQDRYRAFTLHDVGFVVAESSIARTIEPVRKRAVAEFPAVAVTGPRQSGKTTLVQRLSGESHRYVSLEPPDVRAAATADPRAFLELFKPSVIFDEAQHAPSLFPYIKEKIDAHDARDFGDQAMVGYVVHPGNVQLPLGPGVTAHPFAGL